MGQHRERSKKKIRRYRTSRNEPEIDRNASWMSTLPRGAAVRGDAAVVGESMLLWTDLSKI